MDKIVYMSTPAGRFGYALAVENDRMVGRMVSWEEAERVTKERHAKAKAALRAEYMDKAARLGMSFAGYCKRFGVRL